MTLRISLLHSFLFKTIFPNYRKGRHEGRISTLNFKRANFTKLHFIHDSTWDQILAATTLKKSALGTYSTMTFVSAFHWAKNTRKNKSKNWVDKYQVKKAYEQEKFFSIKQAACFTPGTTTASKQHTTYSYVVSREVVKDSLLTGTEPADW